MLLLLLLCSTRMVQAQTCSGTWGPPIIKQTFGQGTPGTAYFGPLSLYAPGATTSTNFVYTYTTDNWSCLSQNAVNGYPGTWVNKKDHTGDPEGLMFLINAPSTAATIFFEYTMNDLCPNTVLQFSVWILNTNIPSITSVSNYQYPNMQINLVDAVTGTVIATTATGNIPADEDWHNFTLVFNNAASTSVKMQLVNNSVGSGYGNDLALDDITVSPCVPLTRISPKLDTVLCRPAAFSFTADVTGNVFAAPEYHWQYSTDLGATWQTLVPPGGTTTVAYTPPGALGEYWVRFLTGPAGASANINCVAVSDTTKIRISPPFSLAPVPDTGVCAGGSIRLHVPGATSYSWSPAAGLSCTDCPDPVAAPLETTTYTVIGRDVYTCADTLSLTVRVDTPLLLTGKACAGISGTAVALVTGPGAATYTWFVGGRPARTVTGTMGDTLADMPAGNYIVNMRSDFCDTTIPFMLSAYPQPVAGFAIDSIWCAGQSYTVENRSSDYSSLVWNMGDGTVLTDEYPVHAYRATGDYTISLVAKNGYCADTAEQIISVREFHVQLTASADTVLMGQQFTLQTSGSDDYTVFRWQPEVLFADHAAVSQRITADESRIYTVQAVSQYGCVDTASVYVAVRSMWLIPSAFTPNGDGKNDYFKPVVSGSSTWTMRIYDRWGKLMYELRSSSGTSSGWDGTYNGMPAEIGVYFYSIETGDDKKEPYKGEVTLIR